jgi:transcriptional regulator with XRE-family HTH domain
MKFGKAIRICRAAQGISQKGLAARANVKPSYVSLIESGKRSPSVKTVEKIAAGLGVPIHLVMILAAEPDEIIKGNAANIREFTSAILELLINSESEEQTKNVRSVSP